MTVAMGVRAEVAMVVGDQDTARAFGSGDVDVLATPRLLALCEEACCRSIGSMLAPGTTTVGMKVRLDHLQPSPVGTKVVADAVLSKAEGRRLTFTVSASDDRGLVAVGKVVRVVVDIERFMSRCGDSPAG